MGSKICTIVHPFTITRAVRNRVGARRRLQCRQNHRNQRSGREGSLRWRKGMGRYDGKRWLPGRQRCGGHRGQFSDLFPDRSFHRHRPMNGGNCLVGIIFAAPAQPQNRKQRSTDPAQKEKHHSSNCNHPASAFVPACRKFIDFLSSHSHRHSLWLSRVVNSILPLNQKTVQSANIFPFTGMRLLLE